MFFSSFRQPRRSFILTVVIVVCLVALTVAPTFTYSFSDRILKVGSSGGDVYELQGRLGYLGYYHGKIDGIFGWQTYSSVRTFQWRFGMKVDGIVGPKTKLMLWKASKTWRPGGGSGKTSAVSSGGASSNDITLMARAVYGEARGEPYTGQVAVAAVILNRLKDSRFPNTISGVIFQPGAFTAVDDGQIWLTPNEKAYRAVRDALNGWDPSGKAIYYFNPHTATSSWIWGRPQVNVIGKHIFAR